MSVPHGVARRNAREWLYLWGNSRALTVHAGPLERSHLFFHLLGEPGIVLAPQPQRRAERHAHFSRPHELPGRVEHAVQAIESYGDHGQVQPRRNHPNAAEERFDVAGGGAHAFRKYRSEEHTSELQSQSNLVCRLLLEKKKTRNQTQYSPD